MWAGCYGPGGGWPTGGIGQSRRTSNEFTEKLVEARASGEVTSQDEWAAVLRRTYGATVQRAAVEWHDGAPTDIDKYTGGRVVTVWPEADYRTGAGRKEYGGIATPRESLEDQQQRRASDEAWIISADGDVG